MIWEVLKNSKAYKLISRDIEKGLNHAYILSSLDSEITPDFFRLIASRVFCLRKDACFSCEECKKIENYSNPDVIEINLEKKKITTADIKDLISSIYISPVCGIRKLYFINAAELMTREAQNKLLKTLEEPPQGVTIFLGASNMSAILDTVKSRARVVPIESFDYETIFTYIREFTKDDESASIAAACSEGRLSQAKNIALSNDYINTFNSALDMLCVVKKSADILSFISSKVYEKNFDDFLNALSVIIRDILIANIDNKLMLSKHVKNKIEELKTEFTPLAASQCLYEVNKARTKVGLNVNVQIVIERLLFSVLEVKYKCR